MTKTISYALTIAILASAPAHAAGFQDRANAFFSSIRESSTEYNCFPNVCRAKAAARGLIWHSDFRACDVAAPGRCVTPKF